MSKTINTLVDDIKKTIEESKGSSAYPFGMAADNIYRDRFESPPEYSSGSLRMSILGTPCERKLWYIVNSEGTPKLDAFTTLKFTYGDILEALLLCLVKDAGHEVSHEQQELDILGIKGHCDAVIDGMLVDVKSASGAAFRKFKTHGLRKDDPFGYLEQASSYLYALKDDPLVTHKDHVGFLVIDKSSGEVTLDVYDVSKMLKAKEKRIEYLKTMVNTPKLPPRGFKDQPKGSSGNRELCMECSYCPYKFNCWDGLRVFGYQDRGNIRNSYLTKVVKTPNVPEVTPNG